MNAKQSKSSCRKAASPRRPLGFFSQARGALAFDFGPGVPSLNLTRNFLTCYAFNSGYSSRSRIAFKSHVHPDRDFFSAPHDISDSFSVGWKFHIAETLISDILSVADPERDLLPSSSSNPTLTNETPISSGEINALVKLGKIRDSISSVHTKTDEKVILKTMERMSKLWNHPDGHLKTFLTRESRQSSDPGSDAHQTVHLGPFGRLEYFMDAIPSLLLEGSRPSRKDLVYLTPYRLAKDMEFILDDNHGILYESQPRESVGVVLKQMDVVLLFLSLSELAMAPSPSGTFNAAQNILSI